MANEWTSVVRKKYGLLEEGWTTRDKMGGHVSGVWKTIKKERWADLLKLKLLARKMGERLNSIMIHRVMRLLLLNDTYNFPILFKGRALLWLKICFLGVGPIG